MSTETETTPASASPTDGPRPTVPEKLKKQTDRWWKTTKAVPQFDEAVTQWRENQKTLFPAKYDVSDPFRGKVPQERRRRKDDRKVRVAHVYRNIMQTVALTVPADHSFHWKPKEMVPDKSTPAAPIGADPLLEQYSRTLELISRRYLEEINWQEIAEGWVQDATTFPMAVIKATFKRDFEGDAVHSHGTENDEQDKVARLEYLMTEFARGTFQKTDADFQEMEDIKNELQQAGQLSIWQGITAENVPMNAFRVDQNIRSCETVYQADWMSHDVLMQRDEVRTKWKYKPNEDGTWEGIHPQDLNASMGTEDPGKELKDEITQKNRSSAMSTATQGRSSQEIKDTDYLLVREIWSKKQNKVFVLVEGVPYPAQTWVPQRQPAQWYPFVILVLNRVYGQVYGVSDVELMADLQFRINRKQSDEEMMRWLGLPRIFYNSAATDGQEIIKWKDVAPGSAKGLNMKGTQGINDLMKIFQYSHDPNAFNSQKDEQNMRAMASLPEQMTGVTGRANFATEVDASMQGAQLLAGFRQRRVTRGLERFYTLIGEMLQQELGQDDVYREVGTKALWPQIYSDQQAKKITAAMKQQIAVQIMPAIQQQAAAQQWLPSATQEALTRQIDALFQEQCTQQYGFPEIMSRETLYRRLQCSVTASMDSQLDKQQRIKGIVSMLTALGQAIQSAQAAQLPFNPRPFVRIIGELANSDEDLDEMFPADVNNQVRNLGQMLQANPNSLQPGAAQALVQMGAQVAQLLQQANAAQQQAAGAASGQPPPQPGVPHGNPTPSQPAQPGPGPGPGAPAGGGSPGPATAPGAG